MKEFTCLNMFLTAHTHTVFRTTVMYLNETFNKDVEFTLKLEGELRILRRVFGGLKDGGVW